MLAMEVEVSFYGALVQPAGGRRVTVQVAGSPPTVGDLRAAVARDLPAVAVYLGQVAVGMGADIYPDDAELLLDREISFLPPVSGG